MATDIPSDDSGEDRPKTPSDARRALDALDADAARLADRVITPWWYHLILGAVFALLIGSQALPGAWSTVAIAVVIIVIAALIIVYRTRYGVSLTAPVGPRSRRVLRVVFLAHLLPVIAAVAIKLTGASASWVLLPTAFGFVSILLLGRHYDDVVRAELAQSADGRA